MERTSDKQRVDFITALRPRMISIQAAYGIYANSREAPMYAYSTLNQVPETNGNLG